MTRGNFLLKDNHEKESMIDVHCHLADNKFNEDLEDVVSRAKQAGLSACIVVAEYESQFDKILDMATKFKGFLMPALGVHPIQKSNKSIQAKHLTKFEAYITEHHDKLACIGEVGLDFSDNVKFPENGKRVQVDLLRRQLEIAKCFDLAVNLHSRAASADTINILRDEGVTKANLHAFAGTIEEALEGVRLGYFFSIPPSFSINDKGADQVKAVDMDNLLLESDSPALGPVKKERNEPMNISVSAHFIAHIKEIPVEEVITKSIENSRKLFKL